MLKKNHKKSTRTLIFMMIVLVLSGLLGASYYYKRVNAAADPRVVPARLAYQEYNRLVQVEDYAGIAIILDSIDRIFEKFPHYAQSYETGVVRVNRAALLMTMALHPDRHAGIPLPEGTEHFSKEDFLDNAEIELNAAISIYLSWDSTISKIPEEEMKKEIAKNFFIGLENYDPGVQEKFLKSRLKELENARIENARRISVALTNLGMIHYHRDDYEKAANQFREALNLWEDNLSAKNNLNSMLGLPLEKRNFFQKMFPKHRLNIP